MSKFLGLALTLLAAAPLVAQSYTWQPARQVTGATKSGAALDVARNVVVRYDGGPVARTLEWNGQRWVARDMGNGEPGPGRREFFSMCYDASRKRVLLFGGKRLQKYGDLTDLWEWDGSSWTEIKIPGPSRSGSLAYDSRAAKLYLLERPTSVWTLGSQGWSAVPVSGSPPTYNSMRWRYDSAQRRFLAYLWPAFPGQQPIEMWSFDGNAWKKLASPHAPNYRWAPAICIDPRSGRLLLFGGSGSPSGPSPRSDLWSFDGRGWQLAKPASTHSPDGRYESTLVPDGQGGILLFGGMEYSDEAIEDTWLWNGNGWKRIHSRLSPPRTQYPTLVWDFGAQELLALGMGRVGQHYSHTPWLWDGARWRKLPQPPEGFACGGSCSDYDGRRGELVVLGNDQWPNHFRNMTWTRKRGQWRQLPVGPSPGRAESAVCFDHARGELLLFGGRDAASNELGDTWIWNGTTWQQRQPSTSPPARWGHRLAYDWLRQRVVLHGGLGYRSGRLPDTWEWDGKTWRRIVDSNGPGERWGPAMAFDWNRGRVVLFGGEDGWSSRTLKSDTWEWNGKSWSLLAPSGRAPASSNGAMAFDHRTRKMLLIAPTSQSIGRPTWLGGPLQPANASSFGKLCGSSRVQPRLYSGAPWIGHPGLALELSDVAPQTPCLFGLSSQTQQTPIGGCTLYLGGAMQLLVATSNAHGYARAAPFAIPWNTALRGTTLHAQALTLDPAMPGGLAFSAGWKLSIGD